MATRKIRLNLASATFPLLTKALGNSIVIPAPGGIEAAVRDTDGASENSQKNTPQPLFVQNFLPTPTGLSSALLTEEQYPPAISGVTLDSTANLYVLRDELDTQVFYITDPLKNYIYNANVKSWKSFSPVLPANRDPATGKEKITIAYLKGKTYICIQGYGLYVYNTTLHTFDNIEELEGVNQYAVKGITSTGTYLILYTDDTIYWSNVNDPLDFTPDLVTGAGSTQVLAVKATIVVLAPIADGFIIYTAKNAVAATVTGDMNNPFVYKEIEGFTGLPSIDNLSYGSSSSSHIAWTPTGLQEVNAQASLNSFPEVTLFLQGKALESYDITSKVVSLLIGEEVLNSKYRVIGNRYVTISYSLSNLNYYTYILVFDMAMKRWGKLAINHVDCFEPASPTEYRRVNCSQVPMPCNSTSPNFDNLDVPLKDRRCDTFSDITITYPDKIKTLGILLPNGKISMASVCTYAEYNNASSLTAYPPVVVVGDLQLARKNMTLLVKAEIKHIGSNAAMLVDTYITNNDAIFKSRTPPKSPYDDTAYDMRIEGRNHRIRIVGNSLLSTMLIEAASTGAR